MSNSPDKLEIGKKPTINAGSKKILVLVAFIVICLILYVLFQIIESGNNPQKEIEKKSEVQEIKVQESSDFAPRPKSSGLLQPEPKPEPEKPKEEKKSFDEIKIVRLPEPDENTKKFIQLRNQRYFEALRSSSVAYKQTNTNNSNNNKQTAINTTTDTIQFPNMPNMQQNEYDSSVASDVDKEQFFERSKPDTNWINPHVRTAGQKYEIKTGSVIPAAMVTGINSDLPGNVIAQVSQNVFDTATGEYILIPQGSKLFGVYDSRVIMGQQRILVAWNRIIFPDGSAMTIPSIPGVDLSGNSGFNQKINNHYFRIFGTSALMALITAGTAYAVDQNSSNNSDDNSLHAQLNASLAQQLGQTASSLLQKYLNIKPTLEIEPGYQFNIVLTKDLVFSSHYRGWR